MTFRFGFRPASEEEPEYEPEPPNYGIGHASTLGGDDDPGIIVFGRHIYLAVQVGPFAFVLGRPD